MISDLRRRRFTAVFDRLDANDDGVLDREDFLVIADKFAKQAGWEQDSPQAEGVRRLYAAWWTQFCVGADSNNDGVLTADELVTGVGAMDRSAFVGGAPMVFDVFDRSGEGLISPAEYRELLSIYGVDSAQADEIFARLDLDGDGYITREEFEELLMTFLFSEDEDDPGTLLFGYY